MESSAGNYELFQPAEQDLTKGNDSRAMTNLICHSPHGAKGGDEQALIVARHSVGGVA